MLSFLMLEKVILSACPPEWVSVPELRALYIKHTQIDIIIFSTTVVCLGTAGMLMPFLCVCEGNLVRGPRMNGMRLVRSLGQLQRVL
jgi:hypothetical protein